MSETGTASELVAALQESKEQVAQRLRAISPETYERGGYERGWNGRQILAHLASIEWTYPRLVDMARVVSTTGDAAQGDASGFDINAYNERQVSKRGQATVPDLIDEFERNRTATIAAIEAADQGLLDTPVISAGAISGKLSEVLRFVAIEHVEQHLKDITGTS
jgi:hypothetical protein